MQKFKLFLLNSQWFWSWLILPLINFSALLLADPFQENITHIAYGNHHVIFVFLWACSCALYLFCYTFLLMQQLQYKKAAGHLALATSCLLMVISVLIPYTQDQTQLLSKLHVNIAMAATVLYILIFFHLLYHCYFYAHSICMIILPKAITLIGSLSCLFLLMGLVSTLLEITFVIGMGFLHFHIQQAIKKSCSNHAIQDSYEKL